MAKESIGFDSRYVFHYQEEKRMGLYLNVPYEGKDAPGQNEAVEFMNGLERQNDIWMD